MHASLLLNLVDTNHEDILTYNNPSLCSVSGETWVLASVLQGGEKLLDIKSGH